MIFCIFLIFCGFACDADPRGARVKRIVGGAPAELPPTDDPVVYLRFAGRSAKVRGVHDYPHYVFRGIRYAHPTKGKDRFLVSTPEFFFFKFCNVMRVKYTWC